MINIFSNLSEGYASYRPTYPVELVEFIAQNCNDNSKAWDCATGNGQLAQLLAPHFDQVYATDISKQQISQAKLDPKIQYSVQAAESTNFPDNYFDLITVAQAIHWFDFERFYQEVKRTAKPDALFCVIGYGLIQINEQADKLINLLYSEILGSYWPLERKYIDQVYKTIPFPFEELETPIMEIKLNWTFAQLCGYLNTWSALALYQQKQGTNPLELIKAGLAKAYAENMTLEIRFPLLIRLAKIKK